MTHRMRRLILTWRVPFAAATALTYLAALGIVVVVFPDVSNLWVAIFVLIGGFTSSVSALGALLVEQP